MPKTQTPIYKPYTNFQIIKNCLNILHYCQKFRQLILLIYDKLQFILLLIILKKTPKNLHLANKIPYIYEIYIQRIT